MKKHLLAFGFDEYDDPSITPLRGAANDARQLAALFQHKLGFDVAEAITHDDLRRGMSPVTLLSKAIAPLKAGDLFVFFLAGHGKSVDLPDGKREQIYLLPDAIRKLLEAGNFNAGVLSLTSIQQLTERAGVRRLLMFDTCLSPIEREAQENRDGDNTVAFEGEDIYRDVIIKKSAIRLTDDLLTIQNSCKNGQRAREVPQKRRGLFALGFEEACTEYVNSGKTITIDTTFDETLDRCINTIAQRHQVNRGDQTPTRHGSNQMVLFDRINHQSANLKHLLQQFETQFNNQQFDTPIGNNCRDTLAELSAKGLDAAEKTQLSERLQQAITNKQHRSNQAHDQRLIELARKVQTISAYERYLTDSRLHEHDAEAHEFITQQAVEQQNWQDARELNDIAAYEHYLQQHPNGAHAKTARSFLERLQQTQASQAQNAAKQHDVQLSQAAAQSTTPLAAWQNCLQQAQTEALKATAQQHITRIQEADRQSWLHAHTENTIAAYQHYLQLHPEGSQHEQAHSQIHALQQQAKQKQQDQAAQQQADQAAWQTAQNTTGSIATQEAAYKHYLKTHPEGNHHQQANQKLSDLTRLRVQQEQEQAQRQAAQRAAEAAERQKQLEAERTKKQAEQEQAQRQAEQRAAEEAAHQRQTEAKQTEKQTKAQPATSTSTNAPSPLANGKVIGAIAAVAVLGLATALFMRSPQPASQTPASAASTSAANTSPTTQSAPTPKPAPKPAAKPTPKPIDPSALLAQAKAAYQQKNTAVAVGNYMQWLQWAQHNSSNINPADFNTAIETISELLAKDLNNHKPSLDWATQLQKYQGFPTNYWQGLLAYCHHTQPNLDQAKTYLSRIQHTSPKQASRDAIQIYSALAKLQLKRIAKKEPC